MNVVNTILYLFSDILVLECKLAIKVYYSVVWSLLCGYICIYQAKVYINSRILRRHINEVCFPYLFARNTETCNFFSLHREHNGLTWFDSSAASWIQVQELISIKARTSGEEGKWRTYGNRNVTKTEVLLDDPHGLKSFKIRLQAGE